MHNLRRAAGLVLVTVYLLTAGYAEKTGVRQGTGTRVRLPGQSGASQTRYRVPTKVHGYASDRVMVKFRSGLEDSKIRSTAAAYRSRSLRKIPRIDVFVLEISEEASVEETMYTLSLNPDVEYVLPDYRTRHTVTPNDTFFKYQYALHNTGQSIGIPGSPQGTSSADIKAPAAWEVTTGDEQVIIAHLDSGIDFAHPDLKNKFISRGRDLVNGDFDATDDNGHGTHTAGIAAAESDNGEGIASVAWNAMLLPVKVLDSEGLGFYSDLIEGIIWAADNGADVMTISLGGDVPAEALEEAVRYALSMNIVMAAAAGNDGGFVLYPAAYDDYVLAVAATDFDDRWQSYSNAGPEVDVAAPAERILSCVPLWYFGDDSFPYGFGFGTSMAAPHVAGMAALLKSHKPWLSALEIMNLIRYTADDINSEDFPGFDEQLGYGRINLERALGTTTLTDRK